jgi:hypothetical protein
MDNIMEHSSIVRKCEELPHLIQSSDLWHSTLPLNYQKITLDNSLVFVLPYHQRRKHKELGGFLPGFFHARRRLGDALQT